MDGRRGDEADTDDGASWWAAEGGAAVRSDRIGCGRMDAANGTMGEAAGSIRGAAAVVVDSGTFLC